MQTSQISVQAPGHHDKVWIRLMSGLTPISDNLRWALPTAPQHSNERGGSIVESCDRQSTTLCSGISENGDRRCLIARFSGAASERACIHRGKVWFAKKEKISFTSFLRAIELHTTAFLLKVKVGECVLQYLAIKLGLKIKCLFSKLYIFYKRHV